MVFGNIVPSYLRALSLEQALELSNMYLEYAYKTSDNDIALVLCHETEVALSQAKSASKKYSANLKDTKYQDLRKGMAAAHIDLGKLLERRGYLGEAQAICKKAEKWGGNADDPGRLAQLENAKQPQGRSSTVDTPVDSTSQHRHGRDIVNVASYIFPNNVRSPSIEFTLPEADERLASTPQLACCLDLLQASLSPDEILDPAALDWLRIIEKDPDEQERLKTMTTEVIRVYMRDELKDAKAVTEVVYLAPVLKKEPFQDLLREFYSGIDHSGLLNVHQLEGIARLIQGAGPGYLDADDLVKILGLVSSRLQDTHQQSTDHMQQLTLTISHVLDAMADSKVKDLDREKLHEPLSAYLTGLKESKDPYLVYQAAYAYQALLCVPDNETVWQSAMRRTGKVIQGVSGLVSAVKGLDFVKFFEGLGDIQKGFAGASMVVEIVKTAYDDVMSLAESGQQFMDCLKEGLSFEHKRDWYSALRGADALIQDGELASFKKLVCEAPCRLDPAFQWGVCQRLGEIAANPMWDTDTRRGAVAFLGEIYENDDVWGQQASVKQWILNILMQLASSSGTVLQLHATVAESLLQELESTENATKQALYKTCRNNGPVSYPLKVAATEIASPSLLDRAQNRSDVEGNLRLLRKQRTKERGNVVYIPPQAKASHQASDTTRFPLMEKVQEFLDSDQKVFLLLGESGSGKSTFNREFEYELWQSYKAKTGRIPLHINLPIIDKPEHDMIAKQLRKAEFTEPQIREMKHYRKFILICDGYDESQQTRNLYTSNRLNQPGEWDAQMVISCRSEYLGDDYRDRFQPGDRNQTSDSSLLQEAVIASFSIDQVQAYIKQYVSVNQPLWQTEDYKQALEVIPSLKDLVKNPFLMTLSLEVLPRMVDPGQNLSATHVTRLALYDHFVEQWLERGKKRLGEKELNPQSRAVFESLSNEGFTQNGIEFLKNLAVAIYRKQGGYPVVKYSRAKDGQSWKAEFFCREDEKQLLREACPLTRSGNQYRFIHRSILEYGLALAVFDPQDWKESSLPEAVFNRRGSASSTLSFEVFDAVEELPATEEKKLDINSPLVWRSFVEDNSLLQFLEERVKQEPVFKQQLFDYIENSKTDEKWRVAAANAITILVRAGVQFIDADLKGIRVPGADMSYGVFDSSQLQGADLRKVNLQGVWLRHADLSGAQMKGVQFGELPYLDEHDSVRSCAYSPDGKSFAAGLMDGRISVYETLNWEKIRILFGHNYSVRHLAYSPKSDQLASCSEDDTIRLWDLESGECQHTLTNHTSYVHGVAYSPQGDLLASASDDLTVRIWDTDSGECRFIMIGHTEGVLSVAYSPDGNQIASGSVDSTVRLWDITMGTCSRIMTGHGDVIWEIAYSPRGDQVASASVDKTIRIWDIKTGDCHRILYGHGNTVYSVAYSPDGSQIASCGKDGTVRLWDVESGVCRHALTGPRAFVFSVVYSPKGDQIISGNGDKTVRLWDASPKASRLVSTGHSEAAVSVKFSPKGDQIASGSMDGTVRLWDMDTGSCRHTFRGHSDTVFSIAYSPQGDLIASGSADHAVRIWDVETGECRHTLTGHYSWVVGVAFSPHGKHVASTSDDGTVRIWDLATEECTTICDSFYGMMGVAYSPDGKLIATGSKNSTIQLWDVEASTSRHTLTGPTDWVRDVAFSPRGNHLASVSDDAVVRIWDVESGECLFILIGHSERIFCVAYSLRGDLLASSSWDKTVRLWDVATGECRVVIRKFQEHIEGVAWSGTSDTNSLVTGIGDGSVFMWDIVEEGDQCRARQRWCATNGVLTLTGASIQDVRGLTGSNRQLLKQRGATGEPVNLMLGASKKALTMSSIVSKFKGPSIRPGVDTLVAQSAGEPSKQVAQQEQEKQPEDPKQPEQSEQAEHLIQPEMAEQQAPSEKTGQVERLEQPKQTLQPEQVEQPVRLMQSDQTEKPVPLEDSQQQEPRECLEQPEQQMQSKETKQPDALQQQPEQLGPMEQQEQQGQLQQSEQLKQPVQSDQQRQQGPVELQDQQVEHPQHT